MRITEAARRLGISPRMLRYREGFGLLPSARAAVPTGRGPAHRRYDEADVKAIASALNLEQKYDIGPAELSFALRVLAEPDVRSRVRELGERIGRLSPPPTRALDFEQERALRLLRR